MKCEADELYFLLYQGNFDLYSWKYRICKSFHRICNLKKIKGFKFQDAKKKQKNIMLSEKIKMKILFVF